MIVLEPTDPLLRWTGLAEFERTDDAWWQPWRLSRAELATAHSPDLLRVAAMPAGVLARFRTGARHLELAVEGPGVTDVRADGELVFRGRPGDGIRLPAGDKLVEVWLPQFGDVRVGPLRLDGPVTAAGARGPLWVTYGSSITQCRDAAGPSETWPALVARENGWELRCLGLDGQCLLDPVPVRAVRDTPAELISLCLGINIHGKACFTGRVLPGQVSGAIHTIREKHPGTPLVVITPIGSPAREHTVNPAGLTLGGIRDHIEAATRTRQRLGDADLHLIDGRELLEPAFLHDGLHPSAEGYHVLASRLGPRLAALAGHP